MESDGLFFRAFLADRSDLWPGGQAEFVRFENRTDRGSAAQFAFNSSLSFGRIVYRQNGQEFHSDWLVIKRMPQFHFDHVYCRLQFTNECHFFAQLLPFLAEQVCASTSIASGNSSGTSNSTSINAGDSSRTRVGADSCSAFNSGPSATSEDSFDSAYNSTFLDTTSNSTSNSPASNSSSGSSSNASITDIFPRFLYSHSRHSPVAQESAIVLEDLCDLGFQAGPRGPFLDYQHLALMMRTLGRFHGASLAAASTKATRFWQLANFIPRINERNFANFATLGMVLLQYYGKLAAADPKYAAGVAAIENLCCNLDELLERVNEGTQLKVICHGDYVVNNVLFRYKDGIPVAMKAIDLGVWRLASPALDLAHVLYLCADQETRDQHWDRLIADYQRGLAEVLPVAELPSTEAILEELRGNSWYELMIAAFFIPHQQDYARDCESFVEVIVKKGLLTEDTKPEQFAALLEEYEIGGSAANEAVLSIIKDMADRGFF